MKGDAEGVLLISSGGLGDTVLFCHVVGRFASLAKSGELVTVLLRSDSIKMSFLLPPEINLISVDFKRLRIDMSYRRKITHSLFKANYRLVVHTDFLRHPDLDEALCKATHSQEIVAMEPRSWKKYDSRLNANRAIYGRLFDSGPEVQDKMLRWSSFAEWLIGSKSVIPPVFIGSSQLIPALKTKDPVVIIQPFSAVKRKQVPPEHYEFIINRLIPKTRIIITGAQDDFEKNIEYKTLLDIPRVEYDGSSFEDLVPLLRAADLVLSVDTALMHLAVAVGAPTICIASAAYVGEIVPYDDSLTPNNVRFVFNPMDCQGCLGNCIHKEIKGMYPCIALHESERLLSVLSDFAPQLVREEK